MSNVVSMQTVEPMRPRDYSPAQLALVRRTVAADTTADEFDMFIEISKRAGLDPFRRQIYCIVYSKDKPDRRKVAFITGIDGFRAVAARNKDYRPNDEEPMIVYDADLKDPATNPLGIERAVSKAYKLAPDGQWFPVIGTAYWTEFAPLKEIWAENDQGKYRPTGRSELDPKSNWYRMGRVMIAKVAEAQALRKGWPEDLSALYSPEEMERSMVDITPSAEIAQHETQLRLERVNATNAVPILWRAGEPIEYVPVGKMPDRAFAFIKGAESGVQLEAWNTTNSGGLREFWALAPTDALAVKKALESRIAELSA